MPARSVRLVLAVFCAASTLVACQSVETTPTPAPTFTCTPEAGGDSFACSQFQYDEMRAKDALYAEAEQVYRTFFAEDVRILRKGGVQQPTPVLLQTTTGAFLEDSMKLYGSLMDDGVASRGGEILLVRLDRAPGASKGGSVVAMTACVDARSTSTYERGERVGSGRLVKDLLYFGSVEGVIKIQGADGKAVPSC